MDWATSPDSSGLKSKESKMKNLLVALIAMFVVGLWAANNHSYAASSAKQCEKASVYLPMAKRKAIKDPTELADRIEASLKTDASGDTVIKGAHTTPNGYLVAVNAAGANVNGIGALPTYLRSLIAKDMPTHKVTMSRVLYKRSKTCDESYEVDVKQGYTRKGIGEEKAWVDPNTGYMILAEDCTNSPIKPITLNEARKRLATAPKSAPKPASELVGQCKEGSHQTMIFHVWDHQSFPSDLKDEYIDIAAAERDFRGPSVSRKLGAKLRRLGKADKIKHVSKSLDIRVSLVKDSRNSFEERDFQTVTAKNGVWKQVFPMKLTKEWSIRIIPAPSESSGVEIVAPSVSPKTGFPETRVHPEGWKDSCRVHVHVVGKTN